MEAVDHSTKVVELRSDTAALVGLILWLDSSLVVDGLASSAEALKTAALKTADPKHGPQNGWQRDSITGTEIL